MAHPSLDLFIRYVRKVTGARGGEDLADGQLLDRFVNAQDQAAFATLMERHGGIVWRVCRGMLHDPNDIEDAFQATFMVLVRRAGSLERRASLGGWLYGVAYRVALKAKAMAARRRLHERQAGAMLNNESSERSAENPDLRPALAEELNRLPEKYRTPLVLCYLEGKSNEEAARQLGCPVGTVWARLTRGRERLRGRLARRGLALSAAALTAALGPETASAAAAVPASLIDSTMKAAVLVATGQAVAGAISAQALALTEGVLHAMWIAKLRIAAALLIAVSLVVGTGAGIATHWAAAGATGTSSAEAHWVIPPSLEGRRPFPPDNWWNQDIANEPVDPNSDVLIASIGAAKPLYPDFGRVHAGEARGLPYVIVSANQPKVPVRFVTYPAESDAGPYPIPLDAPIEGGSIGTGNRHVIVVDRDNWRAYELLDAVREGEGWRASAGAVFDFRTNQLRPRGRTSADGAGLPIFPGLVRYDEVVEQRKIEHALRFTVRQTRRAYVAPARHWANEQTDSNLPPMGMRVRLRADYNISSFPPAAQVILTGLKKYGMFVASHGEDWALSGAPDPRWNEDDLRALERVKGRDFEVVRMGKTEP
jgi:RNA polymerase sigma factor (sigma-70 family)